MSATVDPGPVAAYLGGCPVVDSEGRTFPVEVTYRPRRSDTAGVSGRRRRGAGRAAPRRTATYSRSSPGCARSVRPPTNSKRSPAARAGSAAVARRPAAGAAGPGAAAARPAEGRARHERGGNVGHGGRRDGGGRFGPRPADGVRPVGRHGPAAAGADLAGVGGPAGRAGRADASRACACGCGTSRGTAAGRSRPCPKSAASICAGRCCNCSRSAKRTSRTSRGSTPRGRKPFAVAAIARPTRAARGRRR